MVTQMTVLRPESDFQVAAEEPFQVTAELWWALLPAVAESISQFARPETNGTNTERRGEDGPELEVWL